MWQVNEMLLRLIQTLRQIYLLNTAPLARLPSPKCHGTAHACHEEVTTKASARVGRVAVAGPGCPVLEVDTEYLVENSPR